MTMNLVHFLAKIWLCGGVGKLFFSSLESYFFCYLGAHAKFQSPTVHQPTNLSLHVGNFLWFNARVHYHHAIPAGFDYLSSFEKEILAQKKL